MDDLICRKCGEAWDPTLLHDLAAPYSQAMKQFRREGCVTFGIDCTKYARIALNTVTRYRVHRSRRKRGGSPTYQPFCGIRRPTEAWYEAGKPEGNIAGAHRVGAGPDLLCERCFDAASDARVWKPDRFAEPYEWPQQDTSGRRHRGPFRFNLTKNDVRFVRAAQLNGEPVACHRTRQRLRAGGDMSESPGFDDRGRATDEWIEFKVPKRDAVLLWGLADGERPSEKTESLIEGLVELAKPLPRGGMALPISELAIFQEEREVRRRVRRQ
ncbi:MAG: hypothetical protein M3046_14490 [Actinomycetota bacterium]|nr:hypothetical protein [Actinomycetota bacterium]